VSDATVVATDESGYIQRINALSGWGRVQDAVDEARRGLGVFPESAHLWTALAQMAYRQGDIDVAREASTRGLGIDPHRRWALVVRSTIHAIDGEGRAALELATRVVGEQPDWASAHAHFGYLLSHAGPTRHEEARDAALRAIELEPEEPDHYRVASGVFRRIGDPEGAGRLIESGLDLAPTDENLLLLRAAYAPGGDSEAAGILTSVLAQNPQQRTAARSLTALVWGRLTAIAGVALWLGPVLALIRQPFANSDPSASAIVQCVATLLVTAILAAVMLGRVRGRLPKGYVRRAVARSPLARLGLVLGVMAPLALLLGAAAPGMRLAAAALCAAAGGAGQILVAMAWYRAHLREAHFDRTSDRAAAIDARRTPILRFAFAATYVVLVVGFAPSLAGSGPRPAALIEVGVFALAVLAAATIRLILTQRQVARTGGRPGASGFTAAVVLTLSAVCGFGLLVSAAVLDPSFMSRPTPPDDPAPPVIEVPDFNPPEIDIPDFEMPEFPEIEEP
jgi:hypothetical protein